jgi:hypothetical protein
MALNTAQFEALFTNAFGAPPADLGITVDPSGPDAVGKKGAHTVELLVVQQRAIEWRVDGAPLVAWKQHAKDDPARQQNGEALRAKLV